MGGIGLLIRPDCISEVVKPPPIHPIPNTPAWLSGILNLRGNLVPAFDLALMLDESVAYERPLLLVIDRGEWAAGVKIDGFPQPLSFTVSAACSARCTNAERPRERSVCEGWDRVA